MKNHFSIWLAFLAILAIPSFAQSATIAEALDGPGFSWLSLGAAPHGVPTTVTNDTHDGVDAWKTSSILDGQKNGLRTSVVGPGTLSFWWKVSSEANWDTFGFWIGTNGGVYLTEPSEDEISGEVNWRQQTFIIEEGTHFFEWVYGKDPSSSEGADRAWLDQVFFTPDPPVITNEPLEEIVVAPVGTNVSFSIGYRGNPTPAVFWQLNGTNLVGKTNGTLTLTNVQVSQSGEYRAVITNTYGSDTSTVVAVTVFQPVLLATGLDTTGLVWTTGGDAGANWFAFTNADVSHDGIDVARSGLAPDEYEQLSFDSWVQTTVTGPGTLKFWWKLLGLETDQFYFTMAALDRTNAPPLDETWQEEIITVPTGSKVLRWTYLRDDFISTDDTDGAYLDQVRFIPATNGPPIFSQPEFSTNGFSARIELDPFRGYHIQRSTNLTSWIDVTNFTTTDSIFDFVDSSATNFSLRYYRIKSP